MILFVYALACFVFYLGFIQLDIVQRTFALLTDLRSASKIVTDKNLSDLEKEQSIRHAAIGALGQTLRLMARLLIVLCVSAVPVFVAIVFANLDVVAFTSLSIHPGVLLCTVIALMMIDRARRRLVK